MRDSRHRRERVGARLGLEAPRVESFTAGLWAEDLGAPNEELFAHVRGLRWG
ncbi:hypothetical protein [Streptomyces sp. IMTB 2501]|uniref:hypothetical protein n=1 Tax=Streptomyces sp. IMTB 2501 TaxID=1776340 RepID=UPI0015BE83EB